MGSLADKLVEIKSTVDALLSGTAASKLSECANEITTLSGQGINGFSVDNTFRFSGDIAVPDGTTSIGHYAFYNCENLTSVTIPDSVTGIGISAFRYCINLTSVNIPNGVPAIKDATFWGCTNLTSIVIPSSVESLSASSFSQCSNLTTVIFNRITPPTMIINQWNSVFDGTHADLKIYVPDASVDAYKTATNWVEYADRIYPLSSLPTT